MMHSREDISQMTHSREDTSQMMYSGYKSDDVQ